VSVFVCNLLRQESTKILHKVFQTQIHKKKKKPEALGLVNRLTCLLFSLKGKAVHLSLSPHLCEYAAPGTQKAHGAGLDFKRCNNLCFDPCHQEETLGLCSISTHKSQHEVCLGHPYRSGRNFLVHRLWWGGRGQGRSFLLSPQRYCIIFFVTFILSFDFSVSGAECQKPTHYCGNL